MLVALLWLAQVVLFVGSWLGPWRDAPATHGRLPLWARMLLSASLLVAALVIWQSGARSAAYAQWVAFGMCASLIGDLVMAKLIPFPNRLIGGMIAFGIAHAFYITAFVATMQSFDSAIAGLAVGLGFYGVVAIGGWWMFIRNPHKPLAINVGALAYGMLVGTMASFALALASAIGGTFWLTALGGVLFVTSDFIIGITDIRGTALKNANDWVWLTYAAGQMGIIYASAVSFQ